MELSLAKVARRALLALGVLGCALVTLAACAELAHTGAETPPADQPSYAALAAKYLSSTLRDRSGLEAFEISGVRWVRSFKGWSWVACVHFLDHGHLRTYALFIQKDAVVDGRYAVQSDSCGSQSYTQFDVVTGTLGRPTAPEQPALY